MECRRIRIRDFRNIAEADLCLDSGINILCGENAQGKTNLLEAIGLTSFGKSFRTQHDEEMIRFGAGTASVSVDFRDSVREQNITVFLSQGRKKQFEQNRNRVARVSDIVGEFRTVLFCPEHLSMIKEGPGERRNYLDIAISQLYPVYLKSLQRYNRILKQRNRLIREGQENRRIFEETAEMWSEQLAEEAAVISRYRYRYLKQAEGEIRTCFAEMTGEKEIPSVRYDGSSRQEPEEYEDEKRTAEVYRNLLTAHWDRELGAGTTLYGIHKDDIEILLNGMSARAYASQGQQRSLALAMKLAEGEVCRAVCGEKPVFLFDDVFSELDAGRRAYLSSRIHDRQVIITTCEPFGKAAGKTIAVEKGQYREI